MSPAFSLRCAVCAGEDGQASRFGLPSGEYYIRFAAHCTNDSVTVSSGTYDQCGLMHYVPCQLGFDCADCGRTGIEEHKLRRRTAVLPAIGNRNELSALLSTVHHGLRNGSVLDVSLPDPHAFWLARFNPETGSVARFDSQRAMRGAFAEFVAERRRRRLRNDNSR